ncbi:MAG: YggT family protein [Halobacteriovoraceae bacterium]|nr:YggT family protein [Halobacteriovoraceae bacterium]
MIILIADAVLSNFFPQSMKYPVVQFMRKLADFTLKPARKILPPDMPFDFSPLLVVFIILCIKALW